MTEPSQPLGPLLLRLPLLLLQPSLATHYHIGFLSVPQTCLMCFHLWDFPMTVLLPRMASSDAHLINSLTSFRSSLQCNLLSEASSGYLISIGCSLLPMISQSLPYFSELFALACSTIYRTLYFTFRFYLWFVFLPLSCICNICSTMALIFYCSPLCSLYVE